MNARDAGFWKLKHLRQALCQITGKTCSIESATYTSANENTFIFINDDHAS